MQIIVVILNLCIVLCWATSTYLTDARNYIILNILKPKTNHYDTNEQSMPSESEPYKQFYETRRANNINYKDPFLKRAYEETLKLVVPINQIHSFTLNKKDTNKARLALAALYFQISSMSSNIATSFEKPSRRFFVKKFIGVPTAACNATSILLKSMMIPMSNTSFSFLLNGGAGNAGGSPGGNAGSSPPGEGGQPAGEGDKPAAEGQPPQYFRMSKGKKLNLNPIEGLRASFENSVKYELAKIINISQGKDSPNRIASNVEKKTIKDAFLRISKISNDAFAQTVLRPTRRANYFGNIADRIFKACQSKADLLTSFIPVMGPATSGNASLNFSLLKSLRLG